jgi:hypothetical protein
MHAHWKTPLGYNDRERYMQSLQKTITKFTKVLQQIAVKATEKRKA